MRTAFSKYVASEVIDEIVNNPDRTPAAPQSAEVCFILLQVRDDPVPQAPAYIAKAMEIIVQRNGVVTVMSSVVLAIFGLPIVEDPEKNRDQRSKSVARLVTGLGPDIRLIYGAVGGLVGSFGSAQRLYFGAMLTGFARYPAALTALEFGQTVEVGARSYLNNAGSISWISTFALCLSNRHSM